MKKSFQYWADALHKALSETALTGNKTPELNGQVFVVGNGGSSAVASHIANDIMKVKAMRATCLNDPATLTCFANDYGWEQAYREQMKRWCTPADTLIAISSSGRSNNIINAAIHARFKGARIITLTGFDWDNPLRKIGDTNYWVPSHNYGIVEVAHLAILHELVNAGELPATSHNPYTVPDSPPTPEPPEPHPNARSGPRSADAASAVSPASDIAQLQALAGRLALYYGE